MRKARVVWRGTSLAPASLKRSLRYVLFSPELDTFSVRLANLGDVLSILAEAVDVSVEVVTSFAEELLFDDSVASLLPRHMLRRTGGRTENLLGRQIPRYVVARSAKPRLIVETGVKDGYGSVALLSALERNRCEGAPGELLSFDLNPVAGRAVPGRLRSSWEFVPRSSASMLESLHGRAVNLLISDSSSDYECVVNEVHTALSSSPQQLVVFGNADWNSAIRDAESASYEKKLHSCRLVPDDSLYRSQTIDVAFFRLRGPT